jgi:hypothetical protein
LDTDFLDFPGGRLLVTAGTAKQENNQNQWNKNPFHGKEYAGFNKKEEILV